MPFKSEAQRRYLYANHPTIAKRWAKKTQGNLPSKVKKESAMVKKHADMGALMEMLSGIGGQGQGGGSGDEMQKLIESLRESRTRGGEIGRGEGLELASGDPAARANELGRGVEGDPNLMARRPSGPEEMLSRLYATDPLAAQQQAVSLDAQNPGLMDPRAPAVPEMGGGSDMNLGLGAPPLAEDRILPYGPMSPAELHALLSRVGAGPTGGVEPGADLGAGPTGGVEPGADLGAAAGMAPGTPQASEQDIQDMVAGAGPEQANTLIQQLMGQGTLDPAITEMLQRAGLPMAAAGGGLAAAGLGAKALGAGKKAASFSRTDLSTLF